MPLLDHFRPPLSELRQWRGFFTGWVCALSDSFNDHTLPSCYYAEPTVHVGGRVQVDVATFEEDSSGNGTPVVGTLPKTEIVSSPAWVIPAVFPDSFEVHVINNDGGPRLAAAIELVSPSNKDRPQTRRAFAVKCANYLCQGIPCIVIDVVTNRSANLHNETMELLETDNFLLPAETNLYATAYRPVRRESREEIDAWHAPVILGEPLPQLPLFLDFDLSVVVDFDATYQETCERLRTSDIRLS